MHKDFFLIVSPPRCGSTYLRSLLSSHRQIACHNEVFHQSEVGAFFSGLPKSDVMFDINWRNENPDLFLENMIAYTKDRSPPEIRIVGCKLLLNEYQIQHGSEALLNLKPKIILLSRKNKLAWYSSIHIAFKTKTWASHTSSPMQHTITYDKEKFLSDLKEINAIETSILQRIKENNLDYLQFEYESLSKRKTILKILKFLQVERLDLSAKLIKQNSSDILSRFDNPNVVKEHMKELNKLEWLEDRNNYKQEFNLEPVGLHRLIKRVYRKAKRMTAGIIS